MSTEPNSNPADPLAGLNPDQLLRQGLGGGSAPAGAATQDPSSSGFVPPTPAELQALLPQFEVLELIGRGGMGAVYKARQTALDRQVAIKILPPQVGRDPAFAERFTREAKALARLSHPQIVAVHDAGSVPLPLLGTPSKEHSTDRLYFFVMEFVEGASLRDLIRAGKLPAAEALAIVPQICEALQFAHDEGIVHRDIKPDNILIDTRGRVKIADFGLAKLLDQQQHDVTLTATHQVMGTLRYMAPEQMEGRKEIDHRADIYSLGVVFYELLAGEVPMGRFEPPSQRVEIDVRLDEVVLRSLAREPDKRYQHASDVKTQVETISRSRPAPAAQKQAPDVPLLKLGIQTMPRDLADFLHLAVFIPIVVLMVFVMPTFLAMLICRGAGFTQMASLSIGGMIGFAVTIVLFVILALGSLQNVSIASRGVRLSRFAGPSKFLSWEEITNVRLMNRWEVVRQVWIWPGLPPRGSIMGASSKNYFCLETKDGCWYVCPTDPAAFVATIERIEADRTEQFLQLPPEKRKTGFDGPQPWLACGLMFIVYVVFTFVLSIAAAVPAMLLTVWMLVTSRPGLPAQPTALPNQPGTAIYVKHHDGVARSVATSPDGRFLVTVGDDSLMAIREMATGHRTSLGLYGRPQNDPSQLGLRSVAISNSGTHAYAVGNPREEAIFKVNLENKNVSRLQFHTTATLQAIYPTSTNQLICIRGDTEYHVLEAGGQSLLATPIFPGKYFGNVRSIAMSPSGRFTAVTSSNMETEANGMKSAEPCQLTVFDLQGKEVLKWTMPDYSDFSYTQLAWADEQTLLAALPSGKLHCWNTIDGKVWTAAEPVRIGPGRFLAACLSEDRKSIWLATDWQLTAINYQTGRSTAWVNLDVGPRIGNFAADPIESIAVIKGRNLIAAALWDGRVAIAQPFIELEH